MDKKVTIVNELKNKAILEFDLKAQLGEGAIWNHETQELYWIDIEGMKVHIYNPKTKTNRTIDTPSRIGTIVPIDSEKSVVALHDGVYILNTKTSEYTLLSDAEANIPSNRFNDGKCDPSGRLWVGSMDLNTKPHAANLYMIDAKGEASLKVDSVSISNGIIWSANKKTMYYIDTPTQEIKAFDYDDATGNISNERVAVKVPDSLGGPDGMAIDENGNLWVGMWGGSSVTCFNPNTGQVVSKIDVPAANVTSCAFGGKNLDTLFITSAALYMSEDNQKKYPLAGALFKAVPGVKGVKSDFFKAE
ncbi:SMP-30/gluconolactonase/LRE family protein [Flaviramulus sp. BrNp1-15]|uniref:SMP-30/gluconolactonase/LRE family protein n=1 Tax=Flaviramulus sp. BrNp1-15 TaxID=2916754 RepID=UPI001EE986BC|nr:SMP-30/gluconolactonase/LRE family protein [Flaviramulus sp. BrNp1-15]ULC60546.1 SMP-30/gluconolactonase/LRE family protein [Flaviramulus sp. BrNp1-15]